MENIIRLEDTITVYDILCPLCEILKEKITYLCETQEVPPDIKAQLDTVIYASSRIDIDDLYTLRNLVQRKYGTYYIEAADQNKDGLVNINVVEKLKIRPPVDAFLTIRLKQLCKEKKINYEFPEEIAPDFGQGMDNQFGGQPNPYDPNGMRNNPYGSGPGMGGPGMGNNFNNNNNPYAVGNNNPYGGGNNNMGPGNDFDSYMRNNQPGGGMGPGENPYDAGNNNPYANNNGGSGGNPYDTGNNPYANNNGGNPFNNNNNNNDNSGNPYGGGDMGGNPYA